MMDKCSKSHMFCKCCITKFLSTNNCCPISRQEIKLFDLVEYIPEFITKQIDEIKVNLRYAIILMTFLTKVYCLSKENGCQIGTKVSLIRMHLEHKCEHVYLRC